MVDKITTVPKARLGANIGRLADEDMVRLNRAVLVFWALRRRRMASNQYSDGASKKAGTKIGPGCELAGCPDKVKNSRASRADSRGGCPHINLQVSSLTRSSRRIVKSRTWLGCSTSAFRQLRNEGQHLRDELVFDEFADFVLTALFAAAQQFGTVTSKARASRSREDSVAWLFRSRFGNVGSRHGHASCQLALAQAAA